MITVTKKFSKQLIKAMIVTIIAFIIAVMVCNICEISIQSELIIGFFGVFGGEFGFWPSLRPEKTRKKSPAKRLFARAKISPSKARKKKG